MLQRPIKKQSLLLSSYLAYVWLNMISLVAGIVTEIDPDTLAAGMASGYFRVVVDVRSLREFEEGHIENATLVENLASAGTSFETTNAFDLAGCESCNIALYCRSGARSGVASRYLDTVGGFTNVHDAGGIGDWIRSNREIVTTPSVAASCVVDLTERCSPTSTDAVTDAPTSPPAEAPTPSVLIVPEKKIVPVDDEKDDSSKGIPQFDRGNLNRRNMRRLKGH